MYVLGMPSVLCPYCSERGRFSPRLFGSPYCVRCGWRLQDAEKSSKQSALILFVVAFLGLLLFFGTILRGWPIPIVCLYLICWFGFPIVLGVLSWMDYQNIIVAEPQTVAPNPQDWTVRAMSEYQPWISLSVPRRVRISWKGWLRIAIGTVCLAIDFYILVPPWNLTDFGPRLLRNLNERVIPVSVLLVIGMWINANLIRQRWSHVPLLKSGAVVVGKVLQQKYQNIAIGLDFVGRYSLVEYEFHDQQNLPVRSTGHDYSKCLFQDAPTLVFYDSRDSFRNVALGCSLYTPGNHL